MHILQCSIFSYAKTTMADLQCPVKRVAAGFWYMSDPVFD
jgi:hypothetical protein